MGTAGSDHKPARAASRISLLALRAQPDDRLVTLVREGKEAAYEEVVRRYRPALVRYAATVVPSHHAEDTVQEALIRAHAALRSGDREVTLRAWLYTIVHNGAVSERRKVRPTEQLDETINGVPRPPDIVEGKERLRGVVARLKELPEPQREALVRTELGGESASEIATALGTTTGAVGQLVFRARAALRGGAALVLPMPVIRALLSAPPGGGGAGATATGGLLASALGSGGGSIAVKVGAAVVVAAIAVGPGRAPVGDGERGDAIEIGGGAEAAEAATGGGHAPSHGSGDHHASEATTAGASDGGAETSGGDGTGSRSAAEGSSGSGEGTAQAFEGGEVSTEPAGGSGGSGGDGGGSTGSEPAPPPPDGGGHHDGGGEQPADGGAGYAPPPPDDGGYGDSGGGDWDGGGHDDGHHAYSAPDDGYGDSHDGGDHHSHP